MGTSQGDGRRTGHPDGVVEGCGGGRAGRGGRVFWDERFRRVGEELDVENCGVPFFGGCLRANKHFVSTN